MPKLMPIAQKIMPKCFWRRSLLHEHVVEQCIGMRESYMHPNSQVLIMILIIIDFMMMIITMIIVLLIIIITIITVIVVIVIVVIIIIILTTHCSCFHFGVFLINTSPGVCAARPASSVKVPMNDEIVCAPSWPGVREPRMVPPYETWKWRVPAAQPGVLWVFIGWGNRLKKLPMLGVEQWKWWFN